MCHQVVSLRPWSFSASALPAILIAVLCSSNDAASFRFDHAVLAVIAVTCVHTSANLLNTYFDFQRGVDTSADADDRALVDKTISPSTVLLSAVIFLIAACLIAIYFWSHVGATLLWYFCCGLGLAVAYTAGPLGYVFWHGSQPN